MSPYLLFGFFAAGVLSVFISPAVVERHLGGTGFWPLLKASAFGVPLPLCSCGVIPVSMSLNKHGASKGATVAFLLSTPQTGVDSILVTYSLLGPVFAIFRPLAALVTGLIGGSAVEIFKHKSAETAPETSDETSEKKDQTPKLVKALRHGFVTLPGDIGKPMLLGLVVASIISAAIPEDFFAPFLGGGILSMLVMMAIGIPVYVCATTSVPVAAVLIAKGVSPGAAMVFLMTGPATNAAAFMTIWAGLGKRTAITYILTVAITAIAAGVLLDHLALGMDLDITGCAGWMLPGYAKNISAILLFAVLGWAIMKKARTKSQD